MLDLDQINALDNASKLRYMALEKLFDHPSFKYFIEWAKAQTIDHQQRVLTATNWDQHCFHTGARLAFDSMVNFEDNAEKEFAGYAAEALDNKLDLDELGSALDNE